MAIKDRIKVDMGEVFPHGLYVWANAEVKPARDFEKSTRENLVQRREKVDEDTELPVWQLDALDPDSEARGKDNAVTIEILAKQCPMLPDGATGPVLPIELENLTIGPYVDRQRCRPPRDGQGHRCGGRQAYNYRATGIKAPGKPSARPAGKEQAA